MGTGSKSRYAGTFSTTDIALFFEDQKGIAVSPDAFVDVGKPTLSLIPQTSARSSTSDTNLSALIAAMLILQIEQQTLIFASERSLPATLLGRADEVIE